MLGRVWLWITRPGSDRAQARRKSLSITSPSDVFALLGRDVASGPFPHGEGGYRQLSAPQSPCAPVCAPCAAPGGSCVVASLYAAQTGADGLYGPQNRGETAC